MLDLDKIEDRASDYQAFKRGPDGSRTAHLSADDVPTLIAEVKRLRFHYDQARTVIEGWERIDERVSHHIPEHYEAGYNSLEDWAKDAADVVSKAHTWRKRGRIKADGDELDAAVEKIYPSEDFL